ncbi:O-antigen ligase family protein [uncultured Polaribacter sp.]|uniref:O-antigen ligase family protein n=1 Tax=uncultured Polaribacter sp. TaxID=174711 RepID=UPI00345BCD03
MRNNILNKLIKLSFLSLAILPLLKENINSILIILCSVLIIIYQIKKPQKINFTKQTLILSLPFWMYLFYEVATLNVNLNFLLKQLPFLVFPILFLYKPPFIDKGIRDKSINVFQGSVFLQSLFYITYFLYFNSFRNIFKVRNNIPFFREFVSENYFFEIHPTYFSSFLLISLTISLFNLIKNKNAFKVLNTLNILFTIFFIFLFSSKIIMLIVILTIILFLLISIKNKGIKFAKYSFLGFLILFSLLISPFKNVVGKRLSEIKTEYNKPIVGDYYNSINTRVAILKCAMILQKEMPFLGYGGVLQDKLNDCYSITNDSDFYKKHIFNTHNYYLNLLLYGGWLFLICFLLYLFYIVKKIKHSKIAIFIFFQFLIINLTENYFSRHYGIVLFTYLISMFIFIREEKINNVS